jgi:hypothetical protein
MLKESKTEEYVEYYINLRFYLVLVDKFRLAELTMERKHCKFIPGLFCCSFEHTK